METYTTHFCCSGCNKMHQVYLTEYQPNRLYAFHCPKCGQENQLNDPDLAEVPLLGFGIPENAAIARRLDKKNNN